MSTKRNNVSDELLYAWVDGEAGARAAEVRDLVDNDPAVAAKAEDVRQLGREIVLLVDAAIGPAHGPNAVDTLQALSKIRARIAERKERTIPARVAAWWADVVLFHRKALAGVAVAVAMGMLSAPGVVLLARHHLAARTSEPSPSAITTSVKSPSVAPVATQVRLDIKVIYATNTSVGIDPKLTKLAREFSSLEFTGYELKDASTLVLDLGTAGRVQLPTNDWLTVRPREIADDKLRIDLEIEAMKLKTTLGLARDSTLAIEGPVYADGTLIIAVTRDLKDVIKIDRP